MPTVSGVVTDGSGNTAAWSTSWTVAGPALTLPFTLPATFGGQ